MQIKYNKSCQKIVKTIRKYKENERKKYINKMTDTVNLSEPHYIIVDLLKV